MDELDSIEQYIGQAVIIANSNVVKRAEQLYTVWGTARYDFTPGFTTSFRFTSGIMQTPASLERTSQSFGLEKALNSLHAALGRWAGALAISLNGNRYRRALPVHSTLTSSLEKPSRGYRSVLARIPFKAGRVPARFPLCLACAPLVTRFLQKQWGAGSVKITAA